MGGEEDGEIGQITFVRTKGPPYIRVESNTRLELEAEKEKGIFACLLVPCTIEA